MIKKIIYLVLITGLIVGGVYGYSLYNKMYAPNVNLDGKESVDLFIPTGSDQDDVIQLLVDKKYIGEKESLIWVAERKNYKGKNVVPGKYSIKNGWSNNELITHLRAGRGRLEVQVTFNNVRTIDQLAGKVGKYIEADSVQLISAFKNQDTIKKYGFNSSTFLTLFIPNTYKMNWATSAGEFLQVCAKNYKEFWNEDRKSKAKALGLSQSEVSILASIVQAEQTRHADERPRIAGLYINRIRQGIKLQSDPTVVFAVGDFSLRRVYNKHLEIDSPYNTYKYFGLPPGPINLPEISSIDAVLNYEKHEFIFMCAKPGYEGYHNFSKTNAQHDQYAAEYRRWLDKEGIR